MEHLEPREFDRRTRKRRACGHYDLSLYYGQAFQCDCGREHDLLPRMEIISELPLLRFIVTCPDGGHQTVIKARWDRAKKSLCLEAEMGTTTHTCAQTVVARKGNGHEGDR